MQRGFSLVELSIVLVILGLLVGGIFAGQSLIRASELRAVTSESQRFTTAVMAFRDKYFALPGDFNRAEDVWGQRAAGNTTCRDALSAPGTTTCNGDGDGNVELTSVRSREILRFWQHLSAAGLIEGQYDGAYDGVSGANITPSNAPTSKLATAQWSVGANADIPVVGGYYTWFLPPATNHWFILGKPVSLNYVLTPALLTEEAWNIDTKIDDGKPATGRMTVRYTGVSCASSNLPDAIYQLTVTALACTPLIGF